MELDLQRFYNINRRFLMWIVFFAILLLLREFFALMFLTFIMGFVMRKVARFVTENTRSPYWLSVVGPYLVAVGLLVLLMATAVPRVALEAAEFSRAVPGLLEKFAGEVRQTAARYGMEPLLVRYISPTTQAAGASDTAEADASLTSRPAPDFISTDAMIRKLREIIIGFFPRASDASPGDPLQDLVRKFVIGLVGGTLRFLLAILLSFLIVLDFDHLSTELYSWRNTTVGGFFHEAAASVVEFSNVVGTAFQCQLAVSLLNTVITCVGLFVLDIQPLLLLTTIVFLFGLIPVLGVWISSVPIVLIAFNDHGLDRALLAVALITLVHLFEAYVFNPRIYAARFHLNPVIVLIILLVGHELFGVWGMLLGIPVTHYVLNVAQMPAHPRRALRHVERAAGPVGPHP